MNRRTALQMAIGALVTTQIANTKEEVHETPYGTEGNYKFIENRTIAGKKRAIYATEAIENFVFLDPDTFQPFKTINPVQVTKYLMLDHETNEIMALPSMVKCGQMYQARNLETGQSKTFIL